MTEYAFPHEEWINSTDHNIVNPVRHKGMTLRDYFAAKAMQSAAEEAWTTAEALAVWSYGIADAMLKERNK